MSQSVKRRTRWPKRVKEETREMRLKGKSFSEIIHKFGIPKSTLHSWLRDLGRPERFFGENRKLWWKEMQKLAVEANRKKHAEIYSKINDKAKYEADSISLDNDLYKAILAAIYWAEGAKSTRNILTFVNTDPRLLLLYVTLLRRCYPIDESKFRVRLHLHNYHNEAKVKSFWSDLLSIPLSQFNKTYLKERNKEKTYRQNFGGICFLVYNSVYLKAEIIQFGLLLGERITGRVNIPDISANWL